MGIVRNLGALEPLLWLLLTAFVAAFLSYVTVGHRGAAVARLKAYRAPVETVGRPWDVNPGTRI
jgi:hypothetical protein